MTLLQQETRAAHNGVRLSSKKARWLFSLLLGGD
jgi:hypothetical protein